MGNKYIGTKIISPLYSDYNNYVLDNKYIRNGIIVVDHLVDIVNKDKICKCSLVPNAIIYCREDSSFHKLEVTNEEITETNYKDHIKPLDLVTMGSLSNQLNEFSKNFIPKEESERLAFICDVMALKNMFKLYYSSLEEENTADGNMTYTLYFDIQEEDNIAFKPDDLSYCLTGDGASLTISKKGHDDIICPYNNDKHGFEVKNIIPWDSYGNPTGYPTGKRNLKLSLKYISETDPNQEHPKDFHFYVDFPTIDNIQMKIEQQNTPQESGTFGVFFLKYPLDKKEDPNYFKKVGEDYIPKLVSPPGEDQNYLMWAYLASIDISYVLDKKNVIAPYKHKVSTFFTRPSTYFGEKNTIFVRTKEDIDRDNTGTLLNVLPIMVNGVLYLFKKYPLDQIDDENLKTRITPNSHLSLFYHVFPEQIASKDSPQTILMLDFIANNPNSVT